MGCRFWSNDYIHEIHFSSQVRTRTDNETYPAQEKQALPASPQHLLGCDVRVFVSVHQSGRSQSNTRHRQLSGSCSCKNTFFSTMHLAPHESLSCTTYLPCTPHHFFQTMQKHQEPLSTTTTKMTSFKIDPRNDEEMLPHRTASSWLSFLLGRYRPPIHRSINA